MFYYHNVVTKESSLLLSESLPFGLENLCCHTEVPYSIAQMDPSDYEHE